MSKRFLSLFVCGVLCVLLSGSWITVSAQSSQALIPVSIAFNPKTDGRTYRPADLEQSDEPRAILGEDNRIPVTKREFPWTAIGRIDWVIKDKEISQCTGTLIGKNLILTNSHCLVELQEDKPRPIISRSTEQKGNVRIVFKPNLREGDFAQGDSATVIDYIYGWEAGVKWSEDWAILKLDRNLGDKYGYLGWRTLDFSNSKVLKALKNQVRLAGYSGDYPTRKQRAEEKLEGKEMDTAAIHVGCSIEGSSENLKVAFLPDGTAKYGATGEQISKGLIIHNCDSTGGSSGSAILAKFADEQYYIIGLHAGWNAFNASTIPKGGSREVCRITKRDNEGNVIYDTSNDLEYDSTGICRNRAVRASQWFAQAAKMRSGK
ncbi:trypsin-like serine peptidase [Phormidesmis sp. 146-12]